MRIHVLAGAAMTALWLALPSAPVAAQAAAYKLHCHSIGNSPAEPLGDRDGHSMSTDQFTCRYDGGPFDGAMTTGSNTWEWDKTKATLLAGNGVIRKPGAYGVLEASEGKLALTTGSDGKVTGWTASGKGIYRLATGSAAAVAGKPYSWTAAPTGPGQFSADVKHE